MLKKNIHFEIAVFDLGKFFRLVLSFFKAQALLTNINLQPEKKCSREKQ